MPEIGSRTPPGRLLGVIEGCRSRVQTLIGRLGARRDVDDILQEAFMRSFESGKSGLRNPRTFLLRTANLAFHHVPRTPRLSAHSEDLTLPEVCQLTVDEAPASQVEAQQRFATLCRAVGSLPEECRRAFILKKVYGLSQQDIADRLAVPRAMVEKYIATGLTLCRDYLETASRPVPGSGGDPDARPSDQRHRT